MNPCKIKNYLENRFKGSKVKIENDKVYLFNDNINKYVEVQTL